MADEIKVKMSEFAEATQVNNADDIIILQNGENKKVKSPVLESKLINRTVEELSKEGGVSLNLVNLKGVVATYANLPTTNLQINDAYQVTADGLVYVWNGTAFQPDGQGIKVQPNVNGVVEEGNTNAVSGGEIVETTKVTYKWDSLKTRVVGDWVERSGKIYVVIEDTNENPNISNKYVLLNDDKYRIGFLNSKPNQIIIDNNNRTILFKSGIAVVRGDGRYLTTADQTLTIGNASYSLYFNVNSLEFSITLITNQDKYKGINEVLLGTINGQSNTINVTGFDNYTLNGIQYPYVPSSVTPTKNYYERWFEKYSTSRTEAQKKWLNEALVSVKGYNLNGAKITLYRIGKNVNSGQAYLSFIWNDKGSTITRYLYSADFNNTTNVPYDPLIHSGLKTYEFRLGSRDYDKNIRLKVTIDWDAIPEGDYISESNANASINNTVFNSELIDNFSFQKNRGNQKDLLPIPKLNEYYSYTGDADYSFNNMIPKDNYGDINIWYSKWEELRNGTLPSDYKITRELLTDEVPTGEAPLSIWAYRFSSEALKKADTSEGSNVNKKIKICITTAHHGYEKMGSFCMYEIMKMIIDNDYTSELINYLRYNVEFVIVPCVNPYAWGVNDGAGQRYNYNGVDLNRNFEAGWQFTTAQPSGPFAYSEIESLSVGNWMKREFNDESVIGLVIDNFHGQNETDPKNYYINWLVASDDNLAVNMWREMISEMSVKIKERYPEVPQSNDYIIGTINNYIAGGYTKDQFYQEGYPASFQLEIMQNFRFDPEYKSFDNKAMTCGIESILNLIRYSLNNYISYINCKNMLL